MKRLFALLLALTMMASLTITGFAAEGTGSITITGVSTENTYEIYQLLDLESYDVETGAYSYKINSNWTRFFETDGAKKYVSVDKDGYVAWNAAEDDDTVAAFAKLALAYAQSNGITPVQSSKTAGVFAPGTDAETGKPTGTFSNLALGYYLVDSTMGALCGLTTTNPAAYINAKNAAPTVDKQVQEDSTGQWGDQNTADIGQIVEFRTTISVHAGAQNFVLHDNMSDGLTFAQDVNKNLLYPNDEDPIKATIFRGVWRIEHVIPGVETHVVPAEKYTVNYSTAEAHLGDGCDFEVVFSQEFCDDLETNDKVIVYYNGMLNRNALVGGNPTEKEGGNINEAWLHFGEGYYTTHDTTRTYTFGFDLTKTDSQNKLLDGAGFKIYDAQTGGNEIAVVLMDDGVTYRRARNDETGIEIMVGGGKVRVQGFDNGTYYLEETTTPAGYNKLSGRQKFIISDANLDASISGNTVSTGSGVHVVNKTGSMLPETGGMGKMLFISFGMIVALGTGVLLVTKKRLSMIQD